MLTHRAATILGDIPPDWNRELLTKLLSEHKGGDWGDDAGEAAVRVLRSTNFTDSGTLDFRDVAVRHFSAKKAETFALLQHDLLLERSGGGPTQPVGRMGFITEDLNGYWLSNFVQLLRPDMSRIDPEYLAWVLLEVNRCGVVERLQHQTTQMRNLDYRDYLRVYLPKPSSDEQKAIARILNIANETFVATQIKLASVRSLKAALMQQLFTRGVPARHNKFKPASVFRFEFEVPRSWDTGRLKASLRSVDYGTNEPASEGKRGLPVIAIPQVIAARFHLGDCSFAEVEDSEATALRLVPDDVLLIRTNGNSEYLGKSTVIGDEAKECHMIFASYLIRVRTAQEKLRGRYLNYFLASPLGRRQSLAMANTSAGNHNLGARSIRQFYFPRPTLNEQDEIVALVDAAEDSIETIQREVSAVEGLKKSLLQNLLTGAVRIKVDP